MDFFLFDCCAGKLLKMKTLHYIYLADAFIQSDVQKCIS
uniref:Uncharacterized protein n=1 Tax=Anguilla anguilla TaxID=7936 RepID=A0A0E9U2K4_ANGAN